MLKNGRAPLEQVAMQATFPKPESDISQGFGSIGVIDA
jgi:hypothetical protein